MAIEDQMKKNELSIGPALATDDLTKSEQPVSPVWFYTLFLLSAGSLWLAPKL
jgi:hypothetical protein